LFARAQSKTLIYTKRECGTYIKGEQCSPLQGIKNEENRLYLANNNDFLFSLCKGFTGQYAFILNYGYTTNNNTTNHSYTTK